MQIRILEKNARVKKDLLEFVLDIFKWDFVVQIFYGSTVALSFTVKCHHLQKGSCFISYRCYLVFALYLSFTCVQAGVYTPPPDERQNQDLQEEEEVP